MKNQYFGDKRDLFKFDLLLDLMASGFFRQLTYVPMLTQGDSTGEGRLVGRDAAGHRPDLFAFLREQRSAHARDIRIWREYFSLGRNSGFDYRAYRDDRENYSFHDRAAYFAGIDEKMIRGACILVDPDIGIQRRTLTYMVQRGPEKYLFLDDLAGLLERSRDSLIIVYQHLQKHAGRRLGNIANDVRILSKRLDLVAVPFLHEGDLAFYAIARDESMLRVAARAFFAHAEKTGRLKSHLKDVLHVAQITLGPDAGVSSLAVFGSVARGEQGLQSDIDVIVGFDKPATLRGYFSVQHLLENCLGRDVDLVTEKALRPEMRKFVERDAIHAA
ncbi:MAG: nucleotidyltransferase family protein [Sulfuritalea sp.]|nr:nucleotidyltransferase family protein [Sulfuritalea sp.]